MKLQKIAKALMLPIAVFPAAALLSGCGYALENVQIDWIHAMAVLLQSLGQVILQEMPMLFAISVAYELSYEKKGLAAFNGMLCYFVVISLLSCKNIAYFRQESLLQMNQTFENIDNQFIGILSGWIASLHYNYWCTKQYKNRSIAFLILGTSLISMILVSYLLYLIWPTLFEVLIVIGNFIKDLGPLGAGIYAFLNRLLIPLGMHHMLNSLFWFDVIGINDIGNFWSSHGVVGVTGMYQAGFFPVMMFGIPAIALAMLKCAHPKNRKKMKPFLMSVAFASFFTGVTEPLEFSFMFVAPQLYILHAFITGIVMFIVASFQWVAGFSFSAGLIDFCLSYSMPFACKPYMLLVLGIFVFVVYYFLFQYLIIRFDIHTPGREEEFDPLIASTLTTQEINEIISCIIEACGGSENIVQIRSCITRLRIELKDVHQFQFKKLKHTGAISYCKVGNEIQIIYGAEVDYIMDILEDYQL